MYDEIVKRLRGHANLVREYNESGKLFDEAADAIEKLIRLYIEERNAAVELTGKLASKPHWISVTEALPEDLTRVIVFCEDGVSYGLCEHLIEDDEEVVEWHDFLHYPITPTHWMPLPQPPKEEGMNDE